MIGKAYLIFNISGIIVVNEKGQLIDIVKPKNNIEYISHVEEGSLPKSDLTKLANTLKNNNIGEIFVEDEEMARFLTLHLKDIKVNLDTSSIIFKNVRDNIIAFVQKIGFDDKIYKEKLYELALEVTKSKVRKEAEKRDLFIAQAISSLDDINKILNLYCSRIREWYSLHFPELDKMISDHSLYVKLVHELGYRVNFTLDNLKNIGLDEETAKKISELAKKSMGAEITDFDLNAIKQLTKLALNAFNAREHLEKYIDEAMMEIAPNIRSIVGPLLGARLIALAGGLNKLATLPASTIQVLGAEKALFRALRTGGRPPKHGVIFQYPAIHKSPRWQRGKIARALAAKLAIAARIDAFTGEYKADLLKEELNKRIEEIKTLYAKPPPRKKAIRKEKRRKFQKRKKRNRR